MRFAWPSEKTLRRWIGPACIAGLGVGALIGAIDYRFDVPVITSQGFTSTVTQTSSASAITLPAEVRIVTQTVDKPATEKPAVEKVVNKPAETKISTVTVTKTVTPTPKPVPIERRGKKKETETTTVTVTQPAPGVFNVDRREGN